MGPFRFVPTSPETLMVRGFLFGEGVVTMKVVKIRGRNRIDVKKRVLDYYFCNRDQLGGSLKEFFKRCIIDPNGKTVIIRGQ